MTARPHLPMRPAYLCCACGAPWPCSPAKLALLAEYHGNRLSLVFYLVVAMRELVSDTLALGRQPDLARLHRRFLGWLTVGGPSRSRPPPESPSESSPESSPERRLSDGSVAGGAAGVGERLTGDR